MKRMTKLATIATAITLALSAQVSAAEWRLGHVLPPSHPANIALEKAAAQILEKTEGRVDIKVFPSSQIGGAKEVLTGMTLGTHQMAFDGAGILSQWSPAMGVFEAPFLAKDFTHLERMIDSKKGREIVEEMRVQHGYRMLDVWYYGTRHLTNNREAVNGVADMADMKVRVPEVRLSLSFMKALGATPTPMAFSELYLGLQTGVVDGQENPLPTINAAKFYEVQNHLALTGHLVQFVAPIVSEQAWTSLSESDQTVLIDVFTSAGNAYNQSIVDVEAELISALKDKGMKVTMPDRAAMAAAMAPVYAEFNAVWGAGVYDAIAAVE